MCLLDLAKLPLDARYLDPFFRQCQHGWGQAPDPPLCPGPWPLLDEVNQRDPGSREAYHRMREYVGAHLFSGLAVDFSRWVASHAPDGSSLLVLPLYAFVADYQRQHGNGQGSVLKFWTEFRRLRDAACRQGARYRMSIRSPPWPRLPPFVLFSSPVSSEKLCVSQNRGPSFGPR
ncbi:hypothetical protein GCM10010313_29200 [Streptomyces violarus]|nr:hypothetical protein GCM10010313_29200 [Streptomyces violarus]